MNRIENEAVIPLTEVYNSLPGKRVCKRTVERWVSIGVNGVILESFKQGGRRYTSLEAVSRFLKACNSPGK